MYGRSYPKINIVLYFERLGMARLWLSEQSLVYDTGIILPHLTLPNLVDREVLDYHPR